MWGYLQTPSIGDLGLQSSHVSAVSAVLSWREIAAEEIGGSALRETVLYLLMNVPGLPPIAQAIHIAAVAVVMGSAFFVGLRQLGLAVGSQDPNEVISRLMPFMWWSLPVLVVSGVLFVIARPDRYFFNPIVDIKVICIGVVVVSALVIHAPTRNHSDFWTRSRLHRTGSVVASACLILALLGIILAGRWIAYVDYIYW